MADRVVTDRGAVLRAIEEFDRHGRDAFLAKYGFGRAKRYFVVHEGKRYDSKALYGVAYGLEHPDTGMLAFDQFSGGEAQVATRLRKLRFTIEKSDVAGPDVGTDSALVLAVQEETSGGEYDHWKDIVGDQFHFPNKYRNLVKPGLPFVYYRGVRRKGGKRGSPEYFGVGRIGEVWRDDEDHASKASDQRWYCTVEAYRPFDTPVPWQIETKTLETLKKNQFRDGVRNLPLVV